MRASFIHSQHLKLKNQGNLQQHQQIQQMQQQQMLQHQQQNPDFQQQNFQPNFEKMPSQKLYLPGQIQPAQTLESLDRNGLIHLLCIYEGELQARDHAIHLLKSERCRPENALMRDGKLLRQVTHTPDNNEDNSQASGESVQNLKKMIEMQKDTLVKYRVFFLKSLILG